MATEAARTIILVAVPGEDKMITLEEPETKVTMEIPAAAKVQAEPVLNLLNNENNIKKSVCQFDLDLLGMR